VGETSLSIWKNPVVPGTIKDAMFAFLRGIVDRIAPGLVEIDVNGVGYLVCVPDRALKRLHVGGTTKLLTYCHIREDIFQIYGFLSEDERTLFSTLLSINGVGPKVALSVLSAMSVQEFGRAVSENDVTALTRISGIGKKGAQRIILEMKAKLGQDAELSAILQESAEHGGDQDEVLEALCALGCTTPEARKAATYAREKLGKDAPVEELIRMALRSLAKVK